MPPEFDPVAAPKPNTRFSYFAKCVNGDDKVDASPNPWPVPGIMVKVPLPPCLRLKLTRSGYRSPFRSISPCHCHEEPEFELKLPPREIDPTPSVTPPFTSVESLELARIPAREPDWPAILSREILWYASPPFRRGCSRSFRMKAAKRYPLNDGTPLSSSEGIV